jgi:hypothetical protein
MSDRYMPDNPRPCSFPNCNCCAENCRGEMGRCCFDCRYQHGYEAIRAEEDARVKP